MYPIGEIETDYQELQSEKRINKALANKIEIYKRQYSELVKAKDYPSMIYSEMLLRHKKERKAD